MSVKPDWEAIRKEYEAGGVSLRQLAVKYGVSKSAIGNCKFREQWTEPQKQNSGQWTVDSGHKSVDNEQPGLTVIRTAPLPSPPNAVECAQLGLEALAKILKENKKSNQMDLSDHVKAANALSQYNKVMINAIPVEEDGEDDDSDIITIDTRDLSAERLAKLKAFAVEMKESEQKENGQVG